MTSYQNKKQNRYQNRNQKPVQIEPITDPAKLRARGLYWISKRDYSVKDFTDKLHKVCEIQELIDNLVEDFIKRDWLNEERYLGAFVRTKIAMGLGLYRIKQELQKHGIKGEQTLLHIEELDVDWFEQAKQTYLRKYNDSPVVDFKEKAKRFRYMQYRGFSPDEIKYAMEPQSDDY